MKTEEQLQSPDCLRQLIHRLTITHRTTGLSPPEEDVLVILEAEEAQESCE